jgi:hypothetical protein
MRTRYRAPVIYRIYPAAVIVTSAWRGGGSEQLQVRVLQYQSLSRPAKDGKEATASVEVTSRSGFAIDKALHLWIPVYSVALGKSRVATLVMNFVQREGQCNPAGF